jgi:DNA-binding IclR family transcriptional regulator
VKRREEPIGSYLDLSKLRGDAAALAALAAESHDGPPETEGGGHDRQFVAALARGLEILRVFRPGDGPLGNQDIAQRTGLPKPTVSRLTYTLMKLGHLVYLERLGKYQIGPAVLALGHLALGNLRVRQVARPHLQALADHSNFSVALGSRDRLSMIYLEACRATDTMMLRLDIGTRIPLATTAMGRAFIAGLSERERHYLFDHMSRRYQSRWTTLKRGIERAIREVEDRGFCTSFGDWQSDIYAVGAPLWLPDGGGLMALNCGGERFLATRARLEDDFGPRLVSIAATIRESLGG